MLGEKPYKCDKCPSAFRQNYHLTRHQRCHTGFRLLFEIIPDNLFINSIKLLIKTQFNIKHKL